MCVFPSTKLSKEQKFSTLFSRLVVVVRKADKIMLPGKKGNSPKFLALTDSYRNIMADLHNGICLNAGWTRCYITNAFVNNLNTTPLSPLLPRCFSPMKMTFNVLCIDGYYYCFRLTLLRKLRINGQHATCCGSFPGKAFLSTSRLPFV